MVGFAGVRGWCGSDSSFVSENYEASDWDYRIVISQEQSSSYYMYLLVLCCNILSAWKFCDLKWSNSVVTVSGYYVWDKSCFGRKLVSWTSPSFCTMHLQCLVVVKSLIMDNFELCYGIVPSFLNLSRDALYCNLCMAPHPNATNQKDTLLTLFLLAHTNFDTIVSTFYFRFGRAGYLEVPRIWAF